MAAGGILADLIARDGHEASALPFVASPLGRARMTMELVRGALQSAAGRLRARRPAARDRLWPVGRPDACPRWSGTTPPPLRPRLADKWGVAAPSGESYASVTLRMREWFDSLHGDTVTVAHGGTMRALMVALGIATPLEAADMPIGQGVVYVFSDGKLTKYG